MVVLACAQLIGGEKTLHRILEVCKYVIHVNVKGLYYKLLLYPSDTKNQRCASPPPPPIAGAFACTDIFASFHFVYMYDTAFSIVW